jgi:hypothetical protein
MSKRRNGFTWDEHARLGRALRDVRNDVLIKAACNIPTAYGLNSREARAARRALDAIDRLRCVMDDCVCRESREPEKKPIHIYYGNTMPNLEGRTRVNGPQRNVG